MTPITNGEEPRRPTQDHRLIIRTTLQQLEAEVDEKIAGLVTTKAKIMTAMQDFQRAVDELNVAAAKIDEMTKRLSEVKAAVG